MPPDLIQLLVADHRRLEALFAEIETAPEPAARHAAVDAALAALARHAAHEAEFLHPALREYLPAGSEIAAYEGGEHARIDELLCSVDGLGAALDTVRQHMQEEETELFPRLARACPDGTLRELGERLESARVAD
jgi:iron-sulfur cluster repair protein YtfE (RIC family)